ncbi:hypothetical protein BHE74_00020565 [Ensete ventricosum]|nr:hypothetical protein BHE74_00020565 [Ensete ventricosum]
MREREGVILHLFRVGRWRSVGFLIEITTHDINSRKNESNSAHLLRCESLPRQKNRALSLPVGSLRRSQLWLPRVAVALSCSSARRQTSTMENAVARTVKDVSPHEFVKSYSAHLKRSGKVQSIFSFFSYSLYPIQGRILLSYLVILVGFRFEVLLSSIHLELPEWTDIVKTGRFKELAPYDPDWYYIRAGNTHGITHHSIASMARKIYLRQGIGVGGFQKIYGGRKRNGSCPPHFCKSSGAIARHILRQLERMNIIEIDSKG